MIVQLAAVALSCVVLDTPARIDAWLHGQGMAPASTAYSERFKRPAVLWRGGHRYAIVMPDRGRACVIDMGRDWQPVRETAPE